MDFPELTEKRKEFFKEKLIQHPELIPLREKLLSIDGLEIVPRPETDLEKILENGHLFDNPVEVISGLPSQCHSNCAHIWFHYQDDCKIAVGWGLSDDGLWRQHTWIITHDDRLLETTEERIKYFGVKLNKSESEYFFKCNG